MSTKQSSRHAPPDLEMDLHLTVDADEFLRYQDGHDDDLYFCAAGLLRFFDMPWYGDGQRPARLKVTLSARRRPGAWIVRLQGDSVVSGNFRQWLDGETSEAVRRHFGLPVGTLRDVGNDFSEYNRRVHRLYATVRAV